MGLPSIENFDVSFIERTSENLKNYEGEYEFTMLLNSLLGLIIVPREQQFRRYMKFNSFQKKIKDVEILKSVLSKGNVKLYKGKKEVEQHKFYWLSDSNNEISFNEITVAELMTRMRHSIAHFGIIPVAKPEDKTEWCGVILQNFRPNNRTKNFELYLDEQEVRTISNFIAQKYIDNVKPQCNRKKN